jgi:hypothetical protein
MVSAQKLLYRSFVVQRFQIAKVDLCQFRVKILESIPDIRLDIRDNTLQCLPNEILYNLSAKERSRNKESVGLEYP